MLEKIEGRRRREEGDNRGWDGWMASLTQWTWVWASSGCWSWTGKCDVLQSVRLQRVRQDWATELNWNHFFDMHFSYLGPVSCDFTSWVFLGYTVQSGVAAVWWLLDCRHSLFPSWFPLGLTFEAVVRWWLDLLFTHTAGNNLFSIPFYWERFLDTSRCHFCLHLILPHFSLLLLLLLGEDCATNYYFSNGAINFALGSSRFCFQLQASLRLGSYNLVLRWGRMGGYCYKL